MRTLKFRYLVFIISVALTIAMIQVIVQYDLSQQNSDAELINLAGRQRMLSQRISKLTLFIHYNSVNKKESPFYQLDSLKKLVDVWERVHFQLISQNETGAKSPAIDSLLDNNTHNLEQIVISCRQILNKNDSVTIGKAIGNIAQAELPFLLRMEKTVNTYQKEAEAKLTFLKRLELGLSALAIVILIAGFVFIALPGSTQLQMANNLLRQRNNELTASEEEIRSNLDQIRELQTDLEAKQRQYHGLVDDATDLIYELNEEGKFSFVNPILETKTGFLKNELLGKHYWDLIYHEDVQRVVGFYAEQRRSLTEVSYLELRMQTRHGNPIWIGQNARMFFDQKRVYKVSVVARDIQKIKESEAALAMERILIRTIIDNIPINIYAKNLRSEKILANKAEYEYLGARSEVEVIGKNDFELFPDESAKLSVEEDLQVFDGESILSRETLNIRKDGSHTWFLVSKVPLRNENQEIIGLVGISIDITQQKKAKEELEQSEKLYRLLAENSHDVISLHKLDGTFEYVSPACIELHGYAPKELIGKNGIDFVFEEDAKRILAEAPQVLEKMKTNEPVESSQFRILTKNRGLVWVENLMKPLFENGQLSGFQSTVRDISARKAYQSALEEAKKKAEEATLAKSQFLSMMSHEIRTPMNGIIGLTNILLSESPRPDQVENLELLKFSCNNLLAIINDILDFSKVESGKMELEEISFNLFDVVKHYKKLHDETANQKGIRLTLKMDDRLPATVVGDPLRLGQILNNLIGNAIKFTEHGSVDIKVSQTGVVNGIHTIRFAIKDSGIGIANEKIKLIFEGFNQASSNITRKFGGTGLGLAITKRLLALMKSNIEVTSSLGAGSEFSFELPLAEGKQMPFAKSEMDSSVEYQGVELLLVEDNMVNQVVAKKTLEKWGFRVAIAETGAEAIEKIERNSYALILMDIHMPGMTGYEAAQMIRAKEGEYYKDLTIIALTADVSPEIKENALRSGMNDVLAKPFNPPELRAMLEKYILQKEKSSKDQSRGNSFPKLQAYTEGDSAFEAEFKSLLMKNLVELSEAAERALLENEKEDFRLILHKCKTTISIVDDPPLNNLIQQVKNYLSDDLKITNPNPTLLVEFKHACEDVLRRLKN